MKTMIGAILLGLAAPALQAKVPAAIYTDPTPDKANPAAMAVIHVPSGGVEINGVVYLAAGAGPHPTVVICHGLPGNEKNLDVAHAIRRAGWNVITFNYRGSWGSPGDFRFAQNLQDADAVLAYARDPAHARALRIDPAKLVLMGHSMGGWITALTAAHDHRLLGAALFSAANLARLGAMPREQAAGYLRDNGLEGLAGTSPEIMADEIIANRDAFELQKAAAGLTTTPLLILSVDDGNAPATDALAAEIRAKGGTGVSMVHVATDHGWSDSRIRLESELIDWLGTLR